MKKNCDCSSIVQRSYLLLRREIFMKTAYLIVVLVLAAFAVAYVLACILTRLAGNRKTVCNFIRIRIVMAKVGIVLCVLHFIFTFFYPEELYWFLIGILGGVFLFREIEIGEMILEDLEQ